MELDIKKVNEIVKAALKEDIGPIDVTTTSLIQKATSARADIVAGEDGVACGLKVSEAVFEFLDPDVKFRPEVKDGDPIYADKVICYIEGPARAILTGERTALNFLARLSGVATATRAFAKKCEPYGVKVMDTRKTTPGLRYLEKYAVKAGGGYNHRMGLWDQVLIKDNHLKIISSVVHKQKSSIALDRILKDLRRRIQKNVKIEIEVASLDEFDEAIKGMPDIIMLDNMSPAEVKRALDSRKRSAATPLIEVSGGITLDNIEEYARSRPDMISVGSITHSARSLDLSMEVYG